MSAVRDWMLAGPAAGPDLSGLSDEDLEDELDHAYAVGDLALIWAGRAERARRPKPPAETTPPGVYPDGTVICWVYMGGKQVIPAWIDNPRDWPEWQAGMDAILDAIDRSDQEKVLGHTKTPMAPDGSIAKDRVFPEYWPPWIW